MGPGDVDGEGCAGGKCDDADFGGEEPHTADVVEGTVEGGNLSCDLLNRSVAPNVGAQNLRRNFGKFLHDPVAEIVLRNGSCPDTFTEVMRKLADAEPGCRNRSALVSESAHPSRDDDSIDVDYRAVTTRFDGETNNDCLTLSADGDDDVPREPFELLFSTFGYALGAELPMNAEFIGFDRTRGVYNYYTLDPKTDEDGNFVNRDGEPLDLEDDPSLIDQLAGEWAFFGDSEQYARIYRERLKAKVEAPFHGFFEEEQLEEFQADAANAEAPRCGLCHTGGGLLMKELGNPWVHWNQSNTMPGANQLLDEGEEVLGKGLEARELERTVVIPGNDLWNTNRIDNILASGDARDLMMPLFCTIEVNLQSGDRSAEGGAAVANWPDFMVNPLLLEGRSMPAGLALDGFRLGSSSYRDAIGEIGQQFGDLPMTDTFKRFVYPEVSDADQDYVAQLIDAEVITREFAEAVLAVDITRPIFSDDRCILLDHVPADLEIPAELVDRGLSAPVSRRRQLSEKLEAAVMASLEATEEPAESDEALLRNLTDGAAVDETLAEIGRQCSLRAASNARAFHLDMVRVAAARRNITRHEVRFIEFGGTMPGDEFWGENNQTEEGRSGGLADRDVFFDNECRIAE